MRELLKFFTGSLKLSSKLFVTVFFVFIHLDMHGQMLCRQSFATLTPEGLRNFIVESQVFGSGNPIIRKKVPGHGTFLIVNWGKVLASGRGAQEMNWVRSYVTEFIPQLYSRTLHLSSEKIEQMKRSFDDPHLQRRTVVVLNLDEAETEIRGGMGIVWSESSEALPFEKDVAGYVPEFQLSNYLKVSKRKAEVVRTGIAESTHDPELLLYLVSAVKGVLVQDPRIEQYLFHTSRAHMIHYRRKIPSIRTLLVYEHDGVVENVAAVSRTDVLKEMSP